MAEEVVLMKGNEAIAHAAIRCGADGYFGYPITPQSEVLETLAELKPWETTGMVVLQAESEVAAINMVYGGAGSGKMVMTSSSSPGVSLKQEGISYIAGGRLFPDSKRRRSWRLSPHSPCPCLRTGNGRLREPGLRTRFQIPQPGYHPCRRCHRTDDGKGGSACPKAAPYGCRSH